jgi:hypothetical protein
MSVSILGMEALLKNLSQFHRDRVKRIRTAVEISQAKVVDDARLLVPKRTRALMKSIMPGQILIQADKIEGAINANMDYANYVEFGTGAAGAASQFEGKPADLTYGGKAGMFARPYLTPALIKNRTFFLKQIENVVRP